MLGIAQLLVYCAGPILSTCNFATDTKVVLGLVKLACPAEHKFNSVCCTAYQHQQLLSLVVQVQVYQHVLRSKSVATLMSGRREPPEGVLGIITALRKLCNHPDLLHKAPGGTFLLH